MTGLRYASLAAMVKVKVTRTSWPYARNTHLVLRNESDRRPARHFPCRETHPAEAASWIGENWEHYSEVRESADGSIASSVCPCEKRFQVRSCTFFSPFLHKTQIPMVTTALRFSRTFGWELRSSLTSGPLKCNFGSSGTDHKWHGIISLKNRVLKYWSLSLPLPIQRRQKVKVLIIQCCPISEWTLLFGRFPGLARLTLF